MNKNVPNKNDNTKMEGVEIHIYMHACMHTYNLSRIYRANKLMSSRNNIVNNNYVNRCQGDLLALLSSVIALSFVVGFC